MSPVRDTLVQSYLYLRRAIGLIGLALPLVLIVGQLVIDGRLLHSISGYYYSDLRDVYVGAMCAVGVFLLSYRGYERIDNLVSNVAAVAAIGVALFPTRPPTGATPADQVLGVLHLVAAAVFFLSLAYFCLVLFRRTGGGPVTDRKRTRNGVYLAAGVVILASLALMVLSGLLLDDLLGPDLRLTLWLEMAATTAFGIAWLTKGEMILPDAGERSAALPRRAA